MNETIIRTATISDLPIILEIFNHSITNTTAVYSYELYTLDMMHEWYNEKLANNFPVFVSEFESTITGFVTYGKFRSRPGYKYTAEHSIYVHPDYRRRGIAKQLMKHIINVAQQNDLHALVGGIDAENKMSIVFHEAFGFKQVGYLNEVAYKFGKWLDLVFMQLTFETPKNPVEK